MGWRGEGICDCGGGGGESDCDGGEGCGRSVTGDGVTFCLVV